MDPHLSFIPIDSAIFFESLSDVILSIGKYLDKSTLLNFMLTCRSVYLTLVQDLLELRRKHTLTNGKFKCRYFFKEQYPLFWQMGDIYIDDFTYQSDKIKIYNGSDLIKIEKFPYRKPVDITSTVIPPSVSIETIPKEMAASYNLFPPDYWDKITCRDTIISFRLNLAIWLNDQIIESIHSSLIFGFCIQENHKTWFSLLKFQGITYQFIVDSIDKPSFKNLLRFPWLSIHNYGEYNWLTQKDGIYKSLYPCS